MSFDALGAAGRLDMTGLKLDQALRGADAAREDVEAAEQTAQKFEELFATMLVKELRKGLPEGFFGSGSGADIYSGWLDQNLAQAVARDGALGLAGMIKTSLLGGASVNSAARAAASGMAGGVDPVDDSAKGSIR